MKERTEGVWTTVAALLPPLILAATGWLQAQKKAETQAAEKFAALDSYEEFVVDRMKRDEALERALQNCMALLPAVGHSSPEAEEEAAALEGALAPVLDAPGGTYAMSEPEGSPPDQPAQLDLDEIAEEFGYEQRTIPKN